METLNRKPSTVIRKSMELEDGTKIDVIGITARRMIEISNNKSLSDVDRGVHLTAAKLLVNGKSVVADDLLDGFNDVEFNKILAFANDLKEDGTPEDATKNG